MSELEPPISWLERESKQPARAVGERLWRQFIPRSQDDDEEKARLVDAVWSRIHPQDSQNHACEPAQRFAVRSPRVFILPTKTITHRASNGQKRWNGGMATGK